MARKWEGRLEDIIRSEVDSAELPERDGQEILANIHRQIEERRKIMRISKRKTAVAIVAALAVTGTITAIAAGRVTGLVSHSGRDEAVYSVEELREKAKGKIGSEVKLADGFSNGISFKEGYVITVEGRDDEQNKVLSFPEVNAHYTEGVTLSAHKLMPEIPDGEQAPDRQEDHKGIQLNAKEDQYLFLPPDAKPSEEDLKLEEEGKLYISYGSSEEEREVFRNVSWEQDGIWYLLFTYSDLDMDTLLGMAKEVIDTGK